MATAWLIRTEDDIDAVASTPEIAIDWLLGHGYVHLDEVPFIEVYNKEVDEWELWSMVRVAEYFDSSPMEVLKMLLSGDYEEDIFNWGISLEQVDWIG